MTAGGLPRLVAEHLKGVGFDYEASRTVEPRPCSWYRPPLVTDLKLSGAPLGEYLFVKVDRTVDELVDIYERFVAGFIYSRTEAKTEAMRRGERRGTRRRGMPSDRWLADALSIEYYMARTHFVRPVRGAERLGLHQNLVEFAALVAYNHPVHLEHGEDTFVAVSVRDGLSFGVRGGRLVSNLPRERRKIPVRGLANPGGRLVDLPRGMPEQTLEPLLYDTLRLWLEENQEKVGETAAALLLALTIMRWRSPYAIPGALRTLVSFERSRKALVQACAEARGFEHFDDPQKTLRELFVPHFITVQEFAEMFGNPYQRVALPLSDRTRQKWAQAINSLDPGYQGD